MVVSGVPGETFHFAMTNVHRRFCGATLRRRQQLRAVARPDCSDVVYLYRDEARVFETPMVGSR
jgi:hypothetical protein